MKQFHKDRDLIPLLLLQGKKNIALTLNTKQKNELGEPPKERSFANAYLLCHLNAFVENRRKNEGLGLLSAEVNKRGITSWKLGMSLTVSGNP